MAEVQVNRLHANTHQAAQERQKSTEEELHIDELGLECDKKPHLCQLIQAYSDVFALDPTELGCTNLVTHAIDTGIHPPLRQPARRIPFALRRRVEEMVNTMIEEGVVQSSKSPWASPIVLVAKKDGNTRVCVDYRRLNTITKKDVYPLPRIDDILDSLAHQS